VKWNESTRLALLAAVELAQAGEGRVSAADVARRHGASGHHVAKVLQRLARAGLARAVRGAGGGYRLARPAKDITLYQIVELFEGEALGRRAAGRDKPEPAAGDAAGRVGRVLAELDEQALFTLQSIRLTTLAGR
jgi:Rrf2 family protein